MSVPQRIDAGTGLDELIPHTVVLEPYPVVHKIYNGYSFSRRPSSQEPRRNRWNDALATELEEVPRQLSARVLGRRGWTPGKHSRWVR